MSGGDDVTKIPPQDMRMVALEIVNPQALGEPGPKILVPLMRPMLLKPELAGCTGLHHPALREPILVRGTVAEIAVLFELEVIGDLTPSRLVKASIVSIRKDGGVN